MSNTVPGGGAIGDSDELLDVLVVGFLTVPWFGVAPAQWGLEQLRQAGTSDRGDRDRGDARWSRAAADLVAALAGIGGLVFAIVLFGLLLRSEQGARSIGIKPGRVASRLRGLFGRPPVEGWEIATTKFRARTITLLRARWHWLTLATLVSHLSLYLSAPHGPTVRRSVRGRCRLGRSAGCVCVRPTADRDPIYPRWSWCRRACAHHESLCGGRSPRSSGRRRPHVPRLTYVLPIPVGSEPTSSGVETTRGET